MAVLAAAIVAPAAGVFAAEGHREFTIAFCAVLLVLLVGIGVWTWLGWRAESKVNSELKHG